MESEWLRSRAGCRWLILAVRNRYASGYLRLSEAHGGRVANAEGLDVILEVDMLNSRVTSHFWKQ